VKGINYLIATFFYSGYFPKAPGTFASFVAGIFACLILHFRGINFLFAFFVISTLLGFFSSGYVEKKERKKDPSIVVIDEVAGILASVLIIAFFYNGILWNFVLSFLFFRLYDIFKVFPVNKMENIGGGSGIMLDDIVAGIMAGVSGLVILFIFGKI